MEHELERARREDDEYRSRLELDRTKDDLRNNMENIESIYELRRQLMEEKTNEAKERRLMSIEEICCTVPPLTKPKGVELLMANENTLWIEWDRISLNADNRPIHPESVVYMVYMRNGYRKLCVEDRVLVIPPKEVVVAPAGVVSGTNSVNSRSVATAPTLPSAKTTSKPPTVAVAAPSQMLSPSALKEKLRLRNNARVDRGDDDTRSVNSELSDETSHLQDRKPRLMTSAITTYIEGESNEVEACDVWRGRGAPGEIITAYPDGYFDVAFDDGVFEKRIPRWRIALEDPHQEFTGIDTDHNGISIKPADEFKEGMVISTKSRILRKKKFKEKLYKKLLQLQPNFKSIKEKGKSLTHSITAPLTHLVATAITKLKESRSRPLLAYAIDESSNNVDDDATVDADDDDDSAATYTAEEKFQMNLQAIRRGEQPIYPRDITVKIGPEWELLYVGNGNSYECHGIVPKEVCKAEPNLSVAVSFVYQVKGAEFPMYEFSQVSEPREYYTYPDSVHYNKDLQTVASVVSASTVDTPNASKVGMSKIKKELISSVVGSSIITIERQGGDTFTSEGFSDHFI